MPGGIQLTVAPAGIPREFRREFLDSVYAAESSVPTFEFQPPPDTIMASGMDWRALFASGADVASYVALLALFYDKLVKPRRASHEVDRPHLVLMVERGFNRPAVLRLGDATTDAEIQQFVDHAQALADAPEGPGYPELMWELSSSEVWRPLGRECELGQSEHNT